MDDPIEMLDLLFEGGEEGEYREGDTIMQRLSGEYITFKSTGRSRTDGYSRILKKAAGPVWRNSLAVIARCSPDSDLEVFRKSEATPDVWQGEGGWAHTDDLVDVTPLIEAKVTDEMVEKARDYMSGQTGQTHTRSAIRGVLSAALGIEEGS